MADDISHLIGKYTLKDASKLIDFYKVFGVGEMDKAIAEKIKPEDFSMSIEITQDPKTRVVTVYRNFGGKISSNSFKIGEKYSQDNLMGEIVESVAELVNGAIVDRPQGGIFKGRAASMGPGPGKDLRFSILDNEGKEMVLIIPRDE